MESRFSTALPTVSFKPDDIRPSAVEHIRLTAPTTGDNDEAYGAAKADAAEAASWMIGSSMTASTTFSLVPEVRTFGSGSTEAGSGSTEAVMSLKKCYQAV
jgi:hypothetical protein